jgi:hypothetical protein
MGKSMSIAKNEIIVPLLAVLAVLLAAAGIFQPWWSVRTSPELQMMTNSTMTIDAGLLQTLNVARTDANETSTLAFAITNATAYQDPIFQPITADREDGNLTSTFTFNIGNLADYQGQTKQIADITNLTLPLVEAGLALAIVTMFLIVVATRTKMALERYTYGLGVLAAILLLVTPLQFASGVGNFSGSLSIPNSSLVWKGETLAMWGPSMGWYLTLAASLVIIVCLLPIRTVYSDRKLRAKS